MDNSSHQQTAAVPIEKTLAKLAKRKTKFRILAKLRIAKPCETLICESLRILRNKRKTAGGGGGLRNLAKFVFAKLAKHDLRNMAKHCETLIAKFSKVAKIELHC